MSLVRLPITMYAVRAMLRLPESVTLTGAFCETFDWCGTAHPDVLVLLADFPDAPDGAVAVEPVYTKLGGVQDPVSLTGLRWLAADGGEIKADEEVVSA